MSSDSDSSYGGRGGYSYGGGGYGRAASSSSESESESDHDTRHGGWRSHYGGRGGGMSSGTGAGGNTSSAYGSGAVSHGAASTGRSLEVETYAGPDHDENEQENPDQDRSSAHPSAAETLRDHNRGERPSFEATPSHGSDGGHGIEHDGDGRAHEDGDESENDDDHDDSGTESDRDEDLSLAVVQDIPEDSSSSTHSISGGLGLNSDSENEGANRRNGSNSRDSSRNRGANRGGGVRVGDAEVGFHDIDAALPDNSEAGGIGIYVRLDSTESFSDRDFFNGNPPIVRFQLLDASHPKPRTQQLNDTETAQGNHDGRIQAQAETLQVKLANQLNSITGSYRTLTPEEVPSPRLDEPQPATDSQVPAFEESQRMKYIKALELRIKRDTAPIFASTGYGTIQRQSYANSSTESDFWMPFCHCLPADFSRGPTYTALPGRSHIRVITIRPSMGDEILSCILDTVDLDNIEKPYEAISYQWGSPKVSKTPISISGKEVFISATLTDILMRLRFHDRVRIVWADALCINQGDHAERQQQVGLMRRVYSQASRVVICLGAQKALAKESLSAVKSLTSIWLRFQNSPSATLNKNHGILDKKYRSAVGQSTMKSILQIFQDSYWTRLWVVQEVVSSRLAVVQWGDEEISWTLVGLAAVLIRNQESLWQRFTSSEASEVAVLGLLNAYLMYRLPSANFRGSSMSFLDVLRLTRRFNVTVLLDRIYAVLGLPSQQTEAGKVFITPNYRILREGLYTRVFYWVTATHETPLEILSTVRHIKRIDPGFPTWIPQWHIDPIRSIAGSHHKSMKFNASANCPPNPLFQVNWKLDERSLMLEGLILGVIKSSAKPLPAELPPKATWGARQLAEHNAQLEEWARNHLSSEPKKMALSLTLTAGQDWYGSIIKEGVDYEQHLKGFLDWACTQNWMSSPYNGLTAGQGSLRAERYAQAMRNVCHGRKAFTATDCSMGLGPDVLRPGDLVCVLFGGPVPYILRPFRGNEYHFVGECFVPGHMDGEAIAQWKAGSLGAQEPERFVLK
ncbi:unnamed protein product [Clonostachys chloroleuca]|uniref:Heterokaryon incompatibility domain-containing protein n=1 Tax=Clonostachys chloroleuca TaxID=1926264 RepID=A0AA35MF02_9HYPO|nr:unnamed protein product [Clonostachys chloroleuca]